MTEPEITNWKLYTPGEVAKCYNKSMRAPLNPMRMDGIRSNPFVKVRWEANLS